MHPLLALYSDKARKRSSNHQPPMVFQSDSSTEPIRLLSPDAEVMYDVTKLEGQSFSGLKGPTNTSNP